MMWSVAHPILYFLPLFICLCLHIFLSAAFLIGTRQGVFRFFVYVISCFYMLSYLLIFNHGLTLTTTKIQVDFPGKYIKYENHYGIVRIPVEHIQAVIVEDPQSNPSTVWIQSERQVFYLDRHFLRFSEFLPLLQSLISLGPPQAAGETTAYRVGNYTGVLDLNPGNNILRGSTAYYLPWLGLFSLIAYFLAARAWLGNLRLFQILALLYCIPILMIGIFYKPTLPLVLMLMLYPFYPIFLSAMCLPDSKNSFH